MRKRGLLGPVLEDVQVDKPVPGTAVAEFKGEHDLMTRDATEELLGSLVKENDLVVADFSRAYFVDAAILRLLLNADRVAKRNGRAFCLQLGTTPIVRRVFEASGILEELDVVATREQALERRAG